WLKTLYRKRAVTWPFIFYTIIWTLSFKCYIILKNLIRKKYIVVLISVNV
ncbi:sodium transporter, partial [Enterococcus faecium]